MKTVNRLISATRILSLRHETPLHLILPSKTFSSSSSSSSNHGSYPKLTTPLDNDIGWDTPSSWSTGFATDLFNGQPTPPPPTVAAATTNSYSQPNKLLSDLQETEDKLRELEAENRKSKGFVDGWKGRMVETTLFLKQDPQVYTVEKLAKDYRIMRQGVLAILWLKDLEEEEEKKLGHPLDDSVELLLDNSLNRDEVHYEISKKENDMLYREFVEKLNFNKKKNNVFLVVHRWLERCHMYSRRRPSDGWTFTVEKIGPPGKHGGVGGWKFASMHDRSTRPLNETEKMYVRRETPR
ncbi:hypothetical protein TanjilG_21399 [Lupinus angustifolius]|uniref:Uncharacterized protein n=1 Tax=Lupinus angustifolius TaxID=3871 RepID=A0A4P1RNG7_LUPAN|nr:hypothetical protein TanjilG_21399 [Lupinus angustifolius]